MADEPGSTPLTFDGAPDEHGVVATGGELQIDTLLAAYRGGAFPMRTSKGVLAWFSPDPRAVLVPAQARISKSLRRSRRRYTTTINSAFERVIAACAEREPEDYHWITAEVRAAYTELHRLGWAHSVEAWSVAAEGEPAQLVGGLYGVAVGGLFSGESMFSRAPDASKVALLALLDALGDDGPADADRLVDVQWLTPHLASLGAVEISRADYLARLERALRLSVPKALSERSDA
jgi:leucyl/phenylalanyl-tRNA---protein transferase